MPDVVRLHDRRGVPADYASAVDRYLAAAGLSPGSARIYRIALTSSAWLLTGALPPSGSARRGAHPPALPLTVLEDPATPAVLADAFGLRAAIVDADTVNRELSVLCAAVAWWTAQRWISTDPTIGLSRRPA